MMRDVVFGDASAWDDFVLQNDRSHATIRAKLGNKALDLPILNTSDMAGWLKDHAEMHSAELLAVGYTTTVDLSNVNLKDANEFAQWMLEHYTIHEQVASFLGLPT